MKDERRDFAPVRPEGKREREIWREPPLARFRALWIVEIQQRWSDPSPARRAMIAAAAAWPTEMPSVFAGPSGIRASAAAYEALAWPMPLARHSGDSGSVLMTETSTSCAAAAIAASTEAAEVARATNA